MISTAMLMLPAARAGPEPAPFLTALFTATSAICTTGLEINSTAEYWSPLGHVIITLLTQVGGYGIMTAGLLLTLLVSQRLGLRGRLVLQTEGTGLNLGNARRLLGWLWLTMLGFEAVIAGVVALRLRLHYDYPIGRATWYGVFHAVQAFANGGFSLFGKSLTEFVADPWVSLALALGVVIGSLGFPVLYELRRYWRQPSCWSILTRLTIWGSLLLLAVGFLTVLYFERDNDGTLGRLDPGARMLAAFANSAFPRSGGFSTIDTTAMREETVSFTTILMFIGGGSASPAGGIRVTTFFLLAFVIWAELRGEPDVVISQRRIASVAQRQALTIALLGVAAVTIATLVVVAETQGRAVNQVLFEIVSAFSTSGLSVGLTPDFPPPAQAVQVFLMYVGRLGTIVAGSALALNTRQRRYHYPEERPLVG